LQSEDDVRLHSLDFRRYEAGEAALMVAIPDENLAMVRSDKDSATGALMVRIYRTDRSDPEVVQNITIRAQGNESKETLFDRATKQVHRALQRNWKEKTIVNPQRGNRLQVRVHFSDLAEWAATQQALESVYGINEVALRSLSSREAHVELVFEGTERRLRLALAQADMTLSEPRLNTAGFTGAAGGSLPLVYELYFNNYRPSGGMGFEKNL